MLNTIYILLIVSLLYLLHQLHRIFGAFLAKREKFCLKALLPDHFTAAGQTANNL